MFKAEGSVFALVCHSHLSANLCAARAWLQRAGLGVSSGIRVHRLRYVTTYIYIYIYYVCMYVHVCMYMYMYVCMCVCIYMDMYIYQSTQAALSYTPDEHTAQGGGGPTKIKACINKQTVQSTAGAYYYGADAAASLSLSLSLSLHLSLSLALSLSVPQPHLSSPPLPPLLLLHLEPPCASGCKAELRVEV